MFNSRLETLRQHFGISRPEDWADVAPTWITSMHGYGPGILNYLRLELAIRGLTLRGDRTAEFWKQHLDAAHLDQPLGDPEDEEADRHAICPFTVLIDSAEQQAFGFTGMKQDATDGGRPLIIPTEWRSLGRHPNSFGDYSIDGYQGRVCVERKSMDDAHGTILGFKDGRRDRFESELQNLTEVVMSGGSAMVIVECTEREMYANAPEWGLKTAAENRRTLARSMMRFRHTYKAQWVFLDGRRLAESYTFQWLQMFWRDQQALAKQQAREAVTA